MALACLNYLLIKVEQLRDAHSETDLCLVMVELAKFVFPVCDDSATEDKDLRCVCLNLFEISLVSTLVTHPMVDTSSPLLLLRPHPSPLHI